MYCMAGRSKICNAFWRENCVFFFCGTGNIRLNTMKSGFPTQTIGFKTQTDNNMGLINLDSAGALMEQPKRKAGFDVKLWGLSLISFVPWVVVSVRNKIGRPSTVNRGLRRRARSLGVDHKGNAIRFRPYVSKVPWHTGVRAFLSQLFPRYGHYCGPNWSSGKDRGSPIWDQRPIDWLDFCCYCHDIGYDSHDQADLLKADLAFLECLERPNMSTRGNPQVARAYKTMCITGVPVIKTLL